MDFMKGTTTLGFVPESPETSRRSTKKPHTGLKRVESLRKAGLIGLESRSCARFQGGIIIAVDSRASMGSYIGSQTVKKAWNILRLSGFPRLFLSFLHFFVCLPRFSEVSYVFPPSFHLFATHESLLSTLTLDSSLSSNR